MNEIEKLMVEAYLLMRERGKCLLRIQVIEQRVGQIEEQINALESDPSLSPTPANDRGDSVESDNPTPQELSDIG